MPKLIYCIYLLIYLFSTDMERRLIDRDTVSCPARSLWLLIELSDRRDTTGERDTSCIQLFDAPQTAVSMAPPRFEGIVHTLDIFLVPLSLNIDLFSTLAVIIYE